MPSHTFGPPSGRCSGTSSAATAVPAGDQWQPWSARAGFFVGGNWKCNETVDQVKKLVSELNAGDVPDDIEIVVAPTYIHLAMVRMGRHHGDWITTQTLACVLCS